MFGKKYNWRKIADTLTLEDKQIKQISIDDKKVCVTRIGDQFFACADKCPHAGFPLSEGYIDNRGFIICPLHSMSFSLQNGLDSLKEGYRLKVYPVKVEADGVYLGLTK